MPNQGPYVDPLGMGFKPARIDMGVDYTGSGTLYAMGAGRITNVYNSGWPGGTFIDLLLSEGPYAGKHVYYAENIKPSVKVGQNVSAGTPIGYAPGSYPYIEVGWASGVGGQTMAAKAGQQNKGGDPGAFSTAYGVSMSNLIKSLGGPAGITTPGGIRGSIQSGFPGVSGVSTTADTSAGTTGLPGCIPLIGVIYLAVQSCKRIGRVQSSKRRHRKVLLRKAAKQAESQSTIAGSLCGGKRNVAT